MTPTEIAALLEHGSIAAVVLYLYFVLHKDFERLLTVVVTLATEIKTANQLLLETKPVPIDTTTGTVTSQPATEK